MSLVTVMARDWDLYVNTGTIAVPTWTEIGGLDTHQWDSKKNTTDNTTRASNGNEESYVASRSRSLSLEGIYLEDPDTGARDPGQLAVEALGDAIGPVDSLGQFKLVSPGGKVRTFMGHVEIGEQGGGKDDNTSWGATIDVSGAITVTTE